jgi:hypothetical protein
MSESMTAQQVLNREFLELRAKVLELAASFDRLERYEGDVSADPRLAKIYEGLDVLKSPRADRAEQIQLLFSRAYKDDWQQRFDMPPK